MFYVFMLLGVCSLLGLAYTQQNNKMLACGQQNNLNINGRNFLCGLIFAVILITLILFSGLRTVGNDTATYIKAFENKK